MATSAVTAATNPGAVAGRIRTQLATLRQILHQLGKNPIATIGFELEFNIVDRQGRPLHHSILELIELLGEKRLVAELGGWQGELNLTWRPMEGRPFTALLDEANDLIRRIREGVRLLDSEADIVFIGTLPTARFADIRLSQLTQLERYRLIQEALWDNVSPKITTLTAPDGRTRQVSVTNIGPEAFATSEQPHFYVPGVAFYEVHNTIVATAGPLQAIFSNAPFCNYLEGGADNRLHWMASATHGRAFANGYIDHDLQQIEKSADTNRYPVILTTKDEEDAQAVANRGDIPQLVSLQRQLHTVWPAIVRDVVDTGARHMRAEPRYLSAGPVVTMLSAAAVLGGLLHSPAARQLYRKIPEDVALDNFALANRDGVNAVIRWPDASGNLIRINACDVVLQLLDLATAGLLAAKIDPAEAGRFLGYARASATLRLSGAQWQSQRVQHHKCAGLDQVDAVNLMTREYIRLCNGGTGHHFTSWPPAKDNWTLSML